MVEVTQTPLLLSFAVGAGAFLMLLGLGLALRRHDPVMDRLSTALVAGDTEELGDVEGTRTLIRAHFGSQMERALSATRFGRWLRQKIAASGLTISLVNFCLMELLLATFGLAGGALLSKSLVAPVLGLAAGIYVPFWYIESRRKKRVDLFTVQLADTAALLVSALRAGQSLPQALSRVANESAEPTAGEMRRVVQEMRMGLPMGQALQNLHARIASRDLLLLVTVLDVQRDVGGDVTVVMDSVGETMRDRLRIKAESRAMSAQQRLAAQIMFAMPLMIGGLLFLINPDYMTKGFSTERLICGMPVFVMPLTAALMLGIGYTIVRKAAQVE